MFSADCFSSVDLFSLEVSTKAVVNVNVSFTLIIAVVSVPLCRNVSTYRMLVVVGVIKPGLLTIVTFAVVAVLVAAIAVFEVRSFVGAVTCINLLVVNSELVAIVRFFNDVVSGWVETCSVDVNINPDDVRSSIGRLLKNSNF